MSRFVLIVVLLLCSRQIHSQPGNIMLKKYPLIYDSSQLRAIIPAMDSLNQAFAARRQKGKFYSVPQSRGSFIRLDFSECEDPVADLQTGISLENFLQYYPRTEVTRNLLLLQPTDHWYRSEGEITIAHDGIVDDDRNDLTVKDAFGPSFNFKNKIVYRVYNNDYVRAVEAYFIEEDFTVQEIPARYAAMLDYDSTLFGNCKKLYTGKGYEWGLGWAHTGACMPYKTWAADSFLSWVHQRFGMRGPRAVTIDFEDRTVLVKNIKTCLDSSAALRQLFQTAVDSVTRNHISSNEFDWMIGQLISPEKELELRRQRELSRNCGNDDRPKMQDYMIARLALQLKKLPVFLQAHYYVMLWGRSAWSMSPDQRFHRSRPSYLDELELMHVDVQKFYLASLLRTNRSYHIYELRNERHREITDINDRQAVEQSLVDAIADKELDLYNRLLLARLFACYCMADDAPMRRKHNIHRLNTATASFPGYIRFSFEAYNRLKKEADKEE
jgi:hypothetical protein